MKLRRTALRALLAGLMLVPAAKAQQQAAPGYQDSTALPEGKVGARIRSLIETVNSGDPDRILRFLDEECTSEFRGMVPKDDHVATILGFLRDTGGIEFYGVRSYTPERPGATVVIVKDRNLENWWGMSVRFGEAPDFLVAGIGIQNARPRPAFSSRLSPKRKPSTRSGRSPPGSPRKAGSRGPCLSPGGPTSS